MSLTSSMNIATQALGVSVSAINVVSNNIANISNENYSKLSVHLTDSISGVALSSNASQLAKTLTGVQFDSIQRSANNYLESYYRTANSDYSYLSTYSNTAVRIENITNELSGLGLSDALSAFYDSVNALSQDPTNVTLRQNYIFAAENVCSCFNSSYNNLSQTQESLVGNYLEANSCDSAEIGVEAEQVNKLLDELASINKNIIQTSSSTTSCSALLDKRDELLKDLSNYIPLQTKIENNGTVTVSLGEYKILGGSEVKGYLDVVTGPSADNPVQIDIVKNKNLSTPDNVIHSNVGEVITSGSIGAILDVSGSSANYFTINGVLEDLNDLASAFASTLNEIQQGSITSGGITTYAMCLSSDYSSTEYSTENLFVSKDESTTVINAGNISINSAVKNNFNLIATARTDVFPDGESANVGDNSNMVMVTNTRGRRNDVLNNQTFEGFVSSFASDIGSNVNSLKKAFESQESVRSSIKSELSSKKGVNLDEELSSLMQFQQMYQASAKLFKICSDLMDTIINMV